MELLSSAIFRNNLIYKNVLAGLSVQEQLATGGVLWFSDLTAVDSTWILPVSVGVINLLIVEVSSFVCLSIYQPCPCMRFRARDQTQTTPVTTWDP